MRKIQDYYFKKAKEESYLARSVYKLEEIDRKYGLVKGGMKVLDIGCAPGSWCQYLLKKIGGGAVLGVDLGERVSVRDPRFSYIRGDILLLGPDRLAAEALGTRDETSAGAGRRPFDLVTSDAAPDTSGDRFMDSQRSLRIVERVFELARGLLKPGRSVVAKVFEGEDLKGFVDSLRPEYERVSLFKPKSSRKESKELFIIALERRSNVD
jgi:23S rRNA (uridine2552-2'-O)-methyltransferase